MALLTLDHVEIRRPPLVGVLERQLRRGPFHEHHYLLAGWPVHCGDILELYHNGEWLSGRYEWTASANDEPTLSTGGRTYWLDATKLLRWPEW